MFSAYVIQRTRNLKQGDERKSEQLGLPRRGFHGWNNDRKGPTLQLVTDGCRGTDSFLGIESRSDTEFRSSHSARCREAGF
jgi:hypothetical protein